MENHKENLMDYRIVTSYEMQAEVDAVGTPEFKASVHGILPTLDDAVEGFVEGELIVISGPTKNGKTLFSQSLTAEFCAQNKFPLWFSYEVTPKYFLRAFPELPLFYMPRRMKMNNLDWVLGKMLEGLKEKESRIVFIDHLHYLVDLARMSNASIEVGTVIRRLKTFAVSHGLIVFLMCHTKKGASEPGVELSHESIRDSSFVSQESDSVFLIKRATKTEDDIKHGRATLLVDFHRRTGALKTLINLVKVKGYLREETFLQEDRYGQ